MRISLGRQYTRRDASDNMLRGFFQPALDIAVLIASDEDDFAGFFLSAVYPNGQLAVSAAGQFSVQPLLVPLSLLYMEGAFFLFPAMLCRRIRITPRPARRSP